MDTKPNIKHIIVLLAGLLLAHGQALVLAGSNTGADFLKIPVGARATSLGSAYTAIANDVDSMHWNVAGISRLQDGDGKYVGGIALSHLNLFEGNTINQLGLVMPVEGGNTFWGLSILRMSLAEQQRRDATGQEIGSFGASDLSAGFALAHNFGHVQLGSQIKFIQQKIDNESSSGVAFDFGFLSKTPISRLGLGASVRNLGPRMKFIEDEFNLPLILSVGSVFQISKPFSFALDIQARPDQDLVSVSFGSEFSPIQNISFRAGYLAKLVSAITNSQQNETNRGNIAGIDGITGGMGFKVGKFSLDYAFSPFGELGDTQTFTLSTTFGGRKDLKNEHTRDSNIVIPLEDESDWWK